MLTPHTKKLIALALEEDLGAGGDITSRSVIDPNRTATAVMVARQPVVLAGMEIAAKVFRKVDPALEWSALKRDGEDMEPDEAFATIQGSVRSLLAAERTALNFLQHLTGIATRTRDWVERLADYDTRLLDTRKTLPGWRYLQKEAVRIGGGTNHRFGLFDGILIKDNHIAASGSIAEAIARARDYEPYRKIEIEVTNLSQIQQAISAGADILMLDNMNPDQCAEAVKEIDGEALTEASGNINDETLVAYASANVDFISSGALTHSVKAADLAMKI